MGRHPRKKVQRERGEWTFSTRPQWKIDVLRYVLSWAPDAWPERIRRPKSGGGLILIWDYGRGHRAISRLRYFSPGGPLVPCIRRRLSPKAEDREVIEYLTCLKEDAQTAHSMDWWADGTVMMRLDVHGRLSPFYGPKAKKRADSALELEDKDARKAGLAKSDQ